MLWTALVLGFAGSFHCVGMCGPIALSVGAGQERFGKFFLGKTLYNFGRIFTYGVLGLIIGSLGWGIKIAGYQQLLSFIFGVVMLLFLLSSFTSNFRFPIFKPLQWTHVQMKIMFASILKQQNKTKWFLLGFANGILPCGFVYVALSVAGLQANPLNGTFFMMLFGLGTFPALFAVSFAGNFLSLNFRRVLSKAAPYLVSIVAVLLILRGLNLGVPYVSPTVTNSTEHTCKVDCCQHK